MKLLFPFFLLQLFFYGVVFIFSTCSMSQQLWDQHYPVNVNLMATKERRIPVENECKVVERRTAVEKLFFGCYIGAQGEE